jgi:hypothetical protein
LKRQIGLTLLFILTIGILAIPFGLLIPKEDSGYPKWYYYIESGIYSAFEEVSIHGVRYTLDTDIWRDFFPPSPPNGRPLIAIIKVHAVDMDEFPLSTKIERLWLINEGNIISTLATEEYSVEEGTLEMVFRDGPKWEPEIYIDVVVKLNSVFYPNVYYLMAKNQYIIQTW